MSDLAEKIKELRTAAISELEFCNIEDTPYICAAISDPRNKEKILDQIIDTVARRGLSISGSIYEIEQELNPQN